MPLNPEAMGLVLVVVLVGLEGLRDEVVEEEKEGEEEEEGTILVASHLE